MVMKKIETAASPESIARAAGLLAAALVEPDDARTAALVEAFNDAFIGAVRESWGHKLAAANALLAEAERVLDRAEAARGAERRRLLQLFELLMSAAETDRWR
jgi:hypothetical protein